MKALIYLSILFVSITPGTLQACCDEDFLDSSGDFIDMEGSFIDASQSEEMTESIRALIEDLEEARCFDNGNCQVHLSPLGAMAVIAAQELFIIQRLTDIDNPTPIIDRFRHASEKHSFIKVLADDNHLTRISVMNGNKQDALQLIFYKLGGQHSLEIHHVNMRRYNISKVMHAFPQFDPKDALMNRLLQEELENIRSPQFKSPLLIVPHQVDLDQEINQPKPQSPQAKSVQAIQQQATPPKQPPAPAPATQQQVAHPPQASAPPAPATQQQVAHTQQAPAPAQAQQQVAHPQQAPAPVQATQQQVTHPQQAPAPATQQQVAHPPQASAPAPAQQQATSPQAQAQRNRSIKRMTTRVARFLSLSPTTKRRLKVALITGTSVAIAALARGIFLIYDYYQYGMEHYPDETQEIISDLTMSQESLRELIDFLYELNRQMSIQKIKDDFDIQ